MAAAVFSWANIQSSLKEVLGDEGRQRKLHSGQWRCLWGKGWCPSSELWNQMRSPGAKQTRVMLLQNVKKETLFPSWQRPPGKRVDVHNNKKIPEVHVRYSSWVRRLVDVAIHQLCFQPDCSPFGCEPMLLKKTIYWQPLNIGPSGLFSLSVVPAGWDRWNIVECPALRHRACLFLSLLRLLWLKCKSRSKPKDQKKWANLVEQVYVLYLWNWPGYFPVCLKWLYLSVCMFYCFISTSVLTCTVAVFCVSNLRDL